MPNKDVTKKATLTLCMIVKNEERFLDRCLASVREVVDQIVIVDTGSTDKTCQIASEWGADIFTFDWCDDFSAARNVSIEGAKCDWILWMDADERLQQSSIAELKTLLQPEENPVAYNLHIASRVEGGKGLHLSGAHRLFTNHRGIHFTGRIHEQISPSLVEQGGEERFSNITIDHLGYDQAEVDQSAKAQRNLKLLLQMVRENPQSGYAHYQLAQQYGLMDKHQKAYKHFKVAHRMQQFAPPMRASLLNTMAETCFKLNRKNQAQSLCRESLQLMPEQVGAHLLLYRIALAEGNEERAMEVLQQLAKMNSLLTESGKRISTDVTIPLHKIEYEFAQRHLAREDSVEATACFRRILKAQPDNLAVHRDLSRVYLNAGDYDEAEKHLLVLYEQTPDDPLLLDNLGRVLIKLQKFSEAIEVYQQLLANEGGNQVAVRRLVGLYAKTGDRAKAQKMVEMMGT